MSCTEIGACGLISDFVIAEAELVDGIDTLAQVVVPKQFERWVCTSRNAWGLRAIEIDPFLGYLGDVAILLINEIWGHSY